MCDNNDGLGFNPTSVTPSFPNKPDGVDVSSSNTYAIIKDDASSSSLVSDSATGGTVANSTAPQAAFDASTSTMQALANASAALQALAEASSGVAKMNESSVDEDPPREIGKAEAVKAAARAAAGYTAPIGPGYLYPSPYPKATMMGTAILPKDKASNNKKEGVTEKRATATGGKWKPGGRGRPPKLASTTTKVVVTATASSTAVAEGKNTSKMSVLKTGDRVESSGRPLYHAVRKGALVRSCIFLFWDDAKIHVEDFPDVEHQSFDRWEDAISYVIGGVESRIDVATMATTGTSRTNTVDGKALMDRDGVTETKVISSVPSLDTDATPTPRLPKTYKKRKLASASATASDSSKVSRGTITPQRKKGVHSRPSKKWEAVFAMLQIYKEEHDGNVNVPHGESNHAKLYEWIKRQRASYKAFTEEKDSSMTEEKISRLEGLGLDLRCTSEGRPRSKQFPQQKWLDMLEKLRHYKEEHGDCQIPRQGKDGDPEKEKLRLWCQEQYRGYDRLRQGKKDAGGMTEEKAQMLINIGFEFALTWEYSYAKLCKYRDQFGTIYVPSNHPVLGEWFRKQKDQLCLHIHKKPCCLSVDQIKKLEALGFNTTPGLKVMDSEFEERKWNEHMEELRLYKSEHGHVNVPQTEQSELSRWVAGQRREYRKLHTSKPSSLTAIRMQQLNDVGFQFRPRGGAYVKWDERINALYQYKELFGHGCVPVSHPTLGSFVKKTRTEYKCYLKGKPTAMTEERETELTKLGFVFEASKSPPETFDKPKSWE